MEMHNRVHFYGGKGGVCPFYLLLLVPTKETTKKEAVKK